MKRFPRINPFFIEIIIVILFFSLSAVATLQLLVATHNMSAKDSDLNTGIIYAQNAAESVKGVLSTEEIVNIFPQDTVEQNGDKAIYTLKYGKDWSETSSDPFYTITIEINQNNSICGNLISADINVNRIGGISGSIYELSVTKYLPSVA